MRGVCRVEQVFDARLDRDHLADGVAREKAHRGIAIAGFLTIGLRHTVLVCRRKQLRPQRQPVGRPCRRQPEIGGRDAVEIIGDIAPLPADKTGRARQFNLPRGTDHEIDVRAIKLGLSIAEL